MEIYLVGGAVRDSLLNKPIKERDWVVVGASKQQMLDLGYQQVGKDFPVFLHPDTKEEYALARTERKTGKGYTGFDCNASASVTLEEDLLRRDLTINAMAQTPDGHIIDPYGGQSDIRDKILRHTSKAFVEDPLRILRLARFAASLHAFEFTIAGETQQLLLNMVEDGDLFNLTPERVWRETEKALSTQHPEVYFQVLHDCGALNLIFPELDALFGLSILSQDTTAIDGGKLSLETLKNASSNDNSHAVKFSCLMHILGIQSVAKENRTLLGEYADQSTELISNIIKRLKLPNNIAQLALLTAKHHRSCRDIKTLDAVKTLQLLEMLDAFRREERFKEFLKCLTHIYASHNVTDPKKVSERLNQALTITKKITQQDVKAPHLKGSEIGKAIKQKRLEILEKTISTIPE